MDKLEDEPNVVRLGPMAATAGGLPFTVELWSLSRETPERVLGRASSLVLAKAIFTAARSEHLGRRLVLRRGSSVLQESG